MGKVRDEAPATKTTKPAPKNGGRGSTGMFRWFIANLFRTDTYKPAQGWHARLWTAAGLGLLLLAGVYTYYETQLNDPDRYSPSVRFGVPTVLALFFGWITYRIVQFPPFVDFLTATEAEMNKVSWISKAELKRATVVVLVTVLLLSFYLLGVDLVWQALLKAIGVLRFDGTDLGSHVG